MITKIINGRIICKDEIITGKSVYIKDDIIFDISDCDLPTDNVIDAKDPLDLSIFICTAHWAAILPTETLIQSLNRQIITVGTVQPLFFQQPFQLRMKRL